MRKSGIHNASSGEAARSGWSWSLTGSLVASLCCAGPAVAVLPGLGGASFLLSLSRYRVPQLLLGLGFAVLGVARALRQSRQACSPSHHQRNRWLIPGVALATLAVTYGLLTYAFPMALYNTLRPAARETDQRMQPAQPSPASPTLPDVQEAAPLPEPVDQGGIGGEPEPAAARLQPLAPAQPAAGQTSPPAVLELAAGSRRLCGCRAQHPFAAGRRPGRRGRLAGRSRLGHL